MFNKQDRQVRNPGGQKHPEEGGVAQHAQEQQRSQDARLPQAAAEHRPCARTAAVLRSADEPPAPRVKWRVTLADVAAQAGSAESYCAAVRRWAEATLEQMPGAERRAD